MQECADVVYITAKHRTRLKVKHLRRLSYCCGIPQQLNLWSEFQLMSCRQASRKCCPSQGYCGHNISVLTSLHAQQAISRESKAPNAIRETAVNVLRADVLTLKCCGFLTFSYMHRICLPLLYCQITTSLQPIYYDNLQDKKHTVKGEETSGAFRLSAPASPRTVSELSVQSWIFSLALVCEA
jgi:hypothetical protein